MRSLFRKSSKGVWGRTRHVFEDWFELEDSYRGYEHSVAIRNRFWEFLQKFETRPWLWYLLFYSKLNHQSHTQKHTYTQTKWFMRFSKIAYVLEWCSRFTIFLEKFTNYTYRISLSHWCYGSGRAANTSLTLSLPNTISLLFFFLFLLCCFFGLSLEVLL